MSRRALKESPLGYNSEWLARVRMWRNVTVKPTRHERGLPKLGVTQGEKEHLVAKGFAEKDFYTHPKFPGFLMLTGGQSAKAVTTLREHRGFHQTDHVVIIENE